MFEEYINKKVKVLFKDGEATRTLRGIFINLTQEYGAGFVFLQLSEKTLPTCIRLDKIEKISPSD